MLRCAVLQHAYARPHDAAGYKQGKEQAKLSQHARKIKCPLRLCNINKQERNYASVHKEKKEEMMLCWVFTFIIFTVQIR